MKPICFLFLSVTRINPCLKQQRYQKNCKWHTLMVRLLTERRVLASLADYCQECFINDCLRSMTDCTNSETSSFRLFVLFSLSTEPRSPNRRSQHSWNIAMFSKLFVEHSCCSERMYMNYEWIVSHQRACWINS